MDSGGFPDRTGRPASGALAVHNLSGGKVYSFRIAAAIGALGGLPGLERSGCSASATGRVSPAHRSSGDGVFQCVLQVFSSKRLISRYQGVSARKGSRLLRGNGRARCQGKCAECDDRSTSDRVGNRLYQSRSRLLDLFPAVLNGLPFLAFRKRTARLLAVAAKERFPKHSIQQTSRRRLL